MGAVGLILLVVLWILVIFRQFAPATIGSLLVVLVWGVRLLAFQACDPRRPYSEFDDIDHVQTAFVTMGAGFTFFIAFVVLMAE